MGLNFQSSHKILFTIPGEARNSAEEMSHKLARIRSDTEKPVTHLRMEMDDLVVEATVFLTTFIFLGKM